MDVACRRASCSSRTSSRSSTRPARPGCRRACRSGRETRRQPDGHSHETLGDSSALDAQKGIHDGTSVRARQRPRRSAPLSECRSSRPLQRFARASTARSASSIAGTRITIEYNRPGGEGRELFGALVPWGRVWCPGADTCTSMELSTDVKIDGQALAAGAYSLWAEPDREHWTMIFNTLDARVPHALPRRSGRAAHPGDAQDRPRTWKR